LKEETNNKIFPSLLSFFFFVAIQILSWLYLATVSLSIF
jgi:hypothetical protein